MSLMQEIEALAASLKMQRQDLESEMKRADECSTTTAELVRKIEELRNRAAKTQAGPSSK